MPSFSGKLLYHLYHVPAGQVMDSLRAGGPFEQRRTTRGREAMRQAVFSLPALPPADASTALELYLLTGARFWEQTAFCLWSFAFHSQRTLAPVIYDDGTLTAAHRNPLLRLFPLTRFVSQAETIARLDQIIPSDRFPFLRNRWIHYPNIRKLLDVHVGQAGWKLVIDSDLLFFRRPQFLLDWLASPDVPLHAVDCAESYGYSRPLMESLSGAPIPPLVNVGLCGLCSDALDWEELEGWCRELITREKTNYYLEQALVAMLVARDQPCAIAPVQDYITRPTKAEALNPSAVMHHYVGTAKRWYFQYDWRAVLNASEAPQHGSHH